MSYKDTERSSIYRDAIAAVQDLDPPAVGFNKADQSIGPALSKIVKQNNLLIQVLVKTSEEIVSLRIDLEDLSVKLESRSSRKAKSEIEDSLDALQHQLEKLTIQSESDSVKIPKRKEFPFHVVKDPLQIYKEELNKLKQ